MQPTGCDDMGIYTQASKTIAYACMVRKVQTALLAFEPRPSILSSLLEHCDNENCFTDDRGCTDAALLKMFEAFWFIAHDGSEQAHKIYKGKRH